MWTRFLLFLFIFGIAYAGRPEFPEDLGEIVAHIHNTCVQKTGTTEADINNCENGVFADSRPLKCYMFCFMQEASLVDDDNLVDFDTFIEMIPEKWRAQIAAMVNACRHLDTTDKDSCDKAFEIHQCLYKTNPELYFLF